MKKVLSSKGIFEISNFLYESIKKNNPEIILEEGDFNASSSPENNIDIAKYLYKKFYGIKNGWDGDKFSNIFRIMDLYKKNGKDIGDIEKDLEKMKEKYGVKSNNQESNDRNNKSYNNPNNQESNDRNNKSYNNPNNQESNDKQQIVKNNQDIQKDDEKLQNDYFNMKELKEVIRNKIIICINNFLSNEIKNNQMTTSDIEKTVERFMKPFNEKYSDTFYILDDKIKSDALDVIAKAYNECQEFGEYLKLYYNKMNKNVNETLNVKNKKLLKEDNYIDDNNIFKRFAISGINEIRDMFSRDVVQKITSRVSNNAKIFRNDLYQNNLIQNTSGQNINNEQNQKTNDEQNQKTNDEQNDDNEIKNLLEKKKNKKINKEELNKLSEELNKKIISLYNEIKILHEKRKNRSLNNEELQELKEKLNKIIILLDNGINILYEKKEDDIIENKEIEQLKDLLIILKDSLIEKYSIKIIEYLNNPRNNSLKIKNDDDVKNKICNKYEELFKNKISDLNDEEYINEEYFERYYEEIINEINEKFQWKNQNIKDKLLIGFDENDIQRNEERFKKGINLVYSKLFKGQKNKNGTNLSDIAVERFMNELKDYYENFDDDDSNDFNNIWKNKEIISDAFDKVVDECNKIRELLNI